MRKRLEMGKRRAGQNRAADEKYSKGKGRSRIEQRNEGAARLAEGK